MLNLKSRKARELLALLACEMGGPVPKRRAASLLWDAGPEQGRDSLSKVCRTIQRSSETHGGCIPLEITYGELRLNPESVWCDLAEFRELAGGTEPEDWRRAAALRSGELLAADCFEWSEEYAGWYEIEFLELYRRLADHYRGRGLEKLAAEYEKALY